MADEKPKHKPSPKRTLEEVLKSLQDLIRNDLVSRQGNAAPPEPPPTPAATSTPDAFDEALDKLDDLITHELVEPAKQARVLQPGPDEPLPEEAEWPPEETAIEETDAGNVLPGPEAGHTAKSEATAEPEDERETPFGAEESRFGIQDTLQFEEPPPSLASFLKDTQTEDRNHDAERSETPESPIIEEPAVEVEDGEPGEVIEAFDVPREPNSPPGPEESPLPTLDDGIPVLHEIAEIEPGHEPPTPEQLRHIAIRVIARLNIERRKAGEAPLDIRTIERLQQLLKEALSGDHPRDD